MCFHATERSFWRENKFNACTLKKCVNIDNNDYCDDNDDGFLRKPPVLLFMTPKDHCGIKMA